MRDRRGIPHHQLDTLDVREDASVARYQESARRDIDAIHERGRRAIVVGGSGLYIRALLDVFEFPGTDPQLRERLERRAADEGPGILHRELAALSPEAAAKIPAQNVKRIVRALEVIELTGTHESSPVTAVQPMSGGKQPAMPPQTMFCDVLRLSAIV